MGTAERRQCYACAMLTSCIRIANCLLSSTVETNCPTISGKIDIKEAILRTFVQSGVTDDGPKYLSTSSKAFFENYIWVQKWQDVHCSELWVGEGECFAHLLHSQSVSVAFVLAQKRDDFFSEADRPFRCTLQHTCGRRAINCPVHISLAECCKANGFPAVQQWHRSLVQQREVLSAESMGQLINPYCKVNSDLSYYCSLFWFSSGKSRRADDGLSWPKIDRTNTNSWSLRGGVRIQTWHETVMYSFPSLSSTANGLNIQKCPFHLFILCENQCQPTEWGKLWHLFDSM